MNWAQTGLGVAVASAVVCAVAALLVPRRVRSTVGGVGTAVCGTAGLVSGIGALCGPGFTLVLPALLPLSGVVITVDSLSGVFLAVTGGVAMASGVYNIGYARHGVDSRPVQALLPLFTVAMLLVPAAGGVATLLVCWELMALCSLLLVLAEHRHRPEVASAGRWYAVMTHLGLVAILIGLLVLAGHAGGDAFPVVRQAAESLPAGVATAVFLTTLVGFASKTGIVPLHAWLPRAHPEAPSHVSALMSAAMVNLGVYGLLRVGFDLLGGGPRWWWLLVLTLGALSAVYGILQAAMSTDLKRLLGYSTTENMGLVLVGIGAAGLFATAGESVLAGLALTAALLHVIGHGAFKTVLFLAAGSVVHATGSRDLDALGGLAARMPVTTGMFAWGALAASALPPGTAFVSEWLLLQALIHGLPVSGTGSAVAMPVAVAAVALTAGLSVATFVKAFGVGFLARPRGTGAAAAVEAPVSMRVGMALAALAAGVVALAPTLVLPTVGAVATGTLAPHRGVGSSVYGDSVVAADAVTVRLVGIAGSLSPLLLALALTVAGVLALAATRLVATKRAARRTARVWDCGAGPLTPRMEYTATSFAEPLQRVFDDVLRPETDVDVTPHRESRYLVEAVEYRRRVPDRIERRLYRPVLDLVAAWGRVARGLATGSVHRYLGYGFYTVCALLLVLAVTR